MERNSRRSFVAVSFVLLAILGSALADSNSTNSSTPTQDIKNATAGGHHYGNDDSYDGYGPRYGNSRYEHGYGYDNSHHLVDDYVCDFDASILVVTNSNKKYKKDDDKVLENYGTGSKYGAAEGYGSIGGYGNNNGPSYGNERYGNNDYSNNGNGYVNEGYENDYGDSGNHAIAHRLRCSVVAIRDDKDCSTCCQLAARRDRSVAKERVIGFIVDNDQIYRKDKESHRQKRQNVGSTVISTNPQEGSGSPLRAPVANSPGGKGKYLTKNQRYSKNRSEVPAFPPHNPRCVCCAPKHHYNNYNYDNVQKDYNNNNNNYGSNQQYGGYQPPYGPQSQGSYGSVPGSYNAPLFSYNNNNPYGAGPKYPGK